jgi:hypothetical protein
MTSGEAANESEQASSAPGARNTGRSKGSRPEPGDSVDSHRERIRQRIAFVLLAILAGTIFGSFVAYGLEATRTIEPNQVTIRDLLTLIYAPLVGLVGAATGFYYGSTERHQGDREVE